MCDNYFMEKFDICITGGGISGCACAYIATKLGLKTLLVEKNNYLGGLMTGGLVIPAMKTASENINTEFFEDLISFSKKYNAQIEYKDKNRGWFNPNLLKIVLDDMLSSAGVKILFECGPDKVHVKNNSVSSIDFISDILSVSIEAKYYVDATGSSKIFQLLNEKFLDENIKKQPPSLRFIMSGVNILKFKDFLLKYDKNKDVTNFVKINGAIHLTSAYTWDDKNWGLKPLFDKALKNGDLTLQDTSYFQVFTVAGANGSVAFNCPRLEDYNPLDIFNYSEKLIAARASIYRLSEFMKKYFDGFQNAYISQIADLTGHRDGNRIISEKTVTKDKLLSGNKPDNPILCGDYPIDVHSNNKNDSKLIKTGKYYIDIKPLKSKNYKNLFAVGRNIGADKFAHGALRIQISCMSMGEAVAKYINNNK